MKIKIDYLFAQLFHHPFPPKGEARLLAAGRADKYLLHI